VIDKNCISLCRFFENSYPFGENVCSLENPQGKRSSFEKKGEKREEKKRIVGFEIVDFLIRNRNDH